MRTVFDKAREDAAGLAEDFTYSSIFEGPSTPQMLASFALMENYRVFLTNLIGDYGAKTVEVQHSPAGLERYQYKFILTNKTPDDEYVAVMRFWNDLNKCRIDGDDSVVVMPDDNNLPILSCDAYGLLPLLKKNCDAHGQTKYYKKTFEMIEACAQRLVMSQNPKLRLH